MTDTNEIPLGDVTPVGVAPTNVPNFDIQASPEQMDSLLAEANKRGVSPETDKFLMESMAKFPTPKGKTPTELPLTAVAPIKTFGDVKSGATTHTNQPTFLEQADQALRGAMGNSFYNPLSTQYQNAGKDIANIGGEAVSYAKNFPAEHETVEPGPVTPEEMKQAKVMGIPTSLLNADEGGFVWKKDPNTGEVKAYHPPIYKMGTEGRQALDDATLKSMGLDPAAERARAANLNKNPFDSNADPIANITINNSIGNWVQDQLNPHMAATKQYEALQQTMAAQQVLSTPSEHTKEEVASAQALIDNYKNNVGKGVVERTRDLLNEIKADPTTKLAQFAVALEAEPEFIKIGKLRLGTLLNEAKIASLTADFQKAQKAAKVAKRMEEVNELDLPTGLDKASAVAKAEAKVAGLTGDIKKAKKAEILGNMASEPIIGGAANVALDRAAQEREHGYVTEGSEVAPFVQGAALGTLAAGGEALRLIPRKGEVPVDKVQPVGNVSPEGPAGTPGPPGAPLSPETPINKGNRVPLAAGVDASGKVVHVDENMPNELPMKTTQGVTVNVPVTKMVAYHESVEFPLMHLTGKMDSAGLVDLLKRVQGEGTIPKDVIAKLKKGQSLSYEEAHNIATMAENQRVRALYGVHPDVYQEALQPYIKQAEKPSVTSTPTNLDTKPYSEAGKKALGVAAVAGGGAAIGAALSPDDREEGAKFGTFLPLLSRVFHSEEVGDVATMKRIRLLRKMDFVGSPAGKELRVELEGLKQSGMTPEEIHGKTGYYSDGQGNWYRELSDEGMSIKKGSGAAPGVNMPLSQFIDHPELAKEYPKLWDKLRIEFGLETDPKRNAHFDPKTYTIQAHPNVPIDVIGHEIQHAVQTYEGLPMGASFRTILKNLTEERDTAFANHSRIVAEVKDLIERKQPIPDQLRQDLVKSREKVQRYPENDAALKSMAYAKYAHVIGEAQAFTSQARLKLTNAERAARPPTKDMLPIENQWDSAVKGDLVQHEEPVDEADRLGLPKNTDLPHEPEHLLLAEHGNQRSIGTLYNHYMPRLTRVMDRYMREAGPRLGLAGEDIAQRAFYKAITSLPDFKGNSSFYTWLYKIAKNTALNVVKEMQREVPTESMFKGGEKGGQPGALTGKVGFGGDETGSDPVKASVQAASVEDQTPEMKIASNQISKLVQEAIGVIPKHYGDVLRLRELEGKTDVEVARELNMNVATVRQYNKRGKEQLAQIFRGSEVERAFKRAAGPNNQGGFIDPEMLKRLAKFAVLAGGGAAIGANYFDPQHPYKAMVQGAALALAAGQVNWRNVYGAFKKGMRSEPDVPWREQLNQYDHDLTRGDRLTATTRSVVDGLVNTSESRVKISQHIDGNTTVQLTPREQHVATLVKGLYDQIKLDAASSGVMQNFLTNWIHQTWKASSEVDQLLTDLKNAFKTKPGQPPLSVADQHDLFDKFTSLEQGKARGLEPVSEDVNALIGNYVDGITRAKANNTLINSLKNTLVGQGSNAKLIMTAGRAPGTYVAMGGNQLSRYRVHPSLAPSLEFIYQNKGGNAGILAIESANTAVKRIQVDLSIFHAKSLLDAFLGAGEFGHPWRNFVDAAQAIAGKSRGHEAYLQGGIGDDIDHLIRSLRITPRKGNVPVEDVSTGFYEGLKAVQKTMDDAIPGMGKQSAGRIIQVSKALDHFLWENVHSGLKLMVGMNSLERLRRSYAKEVMKNPLAHVPSTAELADMAGSYTNDIFGGVNWRRLADDANTRWGRELALALANPTGRRIAQVMMFAPDWTYSTVRSFVKAIGPGSFGGLLNPKTIADLHRLYIIRSAFIYATLYNGINFAMSGHMIWDNKRNGKPEPFLVDLGNGEWAQANKHAMEVPQLVKDAMENGGVPSHWLTNKLGNIPSEAAEQLWHKEYLNPDHMPEMKGSRLAHLMKRFLPFSAKSYLEQGPWEAASSALGVPIQGRPNKGENYTPSMKQKDWDQVEADQEKKRVRKEARDKKRSELLLGGD